MTQRPASAYIHGHDGPVVVVPARIARILVRQAGLATFHLEHRGIDPELDEVLVALRDAGHRWAAAHSSVSGTSHDSSDGEDPRYGWLSTTEVARQLGITARAVTKAIAAGRLPAQLLGSRWVLNPEDVAQYAAQREAA